MEQMTLNIPVLALRGLTVFPEQTTGFDVEREISMLALNNAMEEGKDIFLVTQRELAVARPEESDLYAVGTVAHVLQIIKTSDSTVRVVVRGMRKGRIKRLWQTHPFLQANVVLLEDELPVRMTSRVEAVMRQTYLLFGEYRDMVPELSDEIVATVLDCDDPGKLADYIGYTINLRHTDRQRILEEMHPVKRLKLVNEILTHELDVISLEVEMEKKVRDRVGRVQKDMILREQVKVLQHELGDDGDEEIQE